MARAKTPFLFVQSSTSDTKSRTAEQNRAGGIVARHVSVMQGYLFEGIDSWVLSPWEGEGSSGPQVLIRAGECVSLFPVRDRHGRRSRCRPVSPKDRIGLGFLDSRRNPTGCRQRDGGDDVGLRRHDRRSARWAELAVDLRHERRLPDRRHEGRLAGIPVCYRPQGRQPAVRSKSGSRTRRPSDRCIGNDSSACGTSIVQGRSETVMRGARPRVRPSFVTTGLKYVVLNE